ncbi:leucine-rich repeat domain-containing protein [Microscilla marina]|uniref:Cytoplasmic membrane protein n=1 Tax=Microscilla marina ATCC 23134 TaxID=313606 RepID=A1ZHA2_MICM2|nr:leucine-rich repeat domain-containing protein [Microscilla marina]EAY30371.1 cytoplasmic membrane protein [Microscilla marina ATCC 23134]
MGIFNRKSRVEKISLVLDRDSSTYDDYEEKTNKRWQKDLDKVFKGMKKNGTPDELKEFLAYRYPLHCWQYDLIDMKEIIKNTQEMAIDLPEVGYIPPEIGQFTNLNTLILYGRVTNIAEELQKLSKLHTLSIVYDGDFPEVITRLKNLEELILTQGKINNISKNISLLKKLRIFQFNVTRYEKFPQEITKLNNLETLGLMDNKIEEIPASIESLRNLEKLILANNPLQKISPKITGLKKLKALDIRHTNLTEETKIQLPKWLPHTEITF